MTKFIMLLVMYTPTKHKPNKSSHVDFMLIYRKRSRRQPWMAWGSREHPSSKRLWYPWARHSQHLACITLVGSSLVLEGRTRMEGRPFTSVLDVEVELQRPKYVLTWSYLPNTSAAYLLFYFLGIALGNLRDPPVLGEWVENKCIFELYTLLKLCSPGQETRIQVCFLISMRCTIQVYYPVFPEGCSP